VLETHRQWPLLVIATRIDVVERSELSYGYCSWFRLSTLDVRRPTVSQLCVVVPAGTYLCLIDC